jgi:predicted transcriptional regulator
MSPTKGKKEMWFTQIFKDSNDYNEKTIIGFISFAMLVLTAIIDLGSGIVGHDLVITEYIYNSFVTITLGSFGVAGLERFSPAAKVEAEAAVAAPSSEPTPENNTCANCGCVN